MTFVPLFDDSFYFIVIPVLPSIVIALRFTFINTTGTLLDYYKY